MLGLFRRSRAQQSSRGSHRVPEGTRVYAIGDVHGCRPELDELLERIDAESGSSGADKHLIFLGDLVDRGPDSAGTVALLASGHLPGDRHSFLMGNHEEAMLKVWHGHGDVIPGWLRYGGIQTLESYGIDRAEVFRLGLDLPARMHQVIPLDHIEFLESFRDSLTIGDYAFVHAGVRPGIPLDQQEAADLRWIRDDFLLDDLSDHGFKIVHGHTISSEPAVRSNRIGIDTGCYQSGRLTALVLEGADHRFLATGGG